MDGEDFIIIEGGLVQNNPSLPVFDLDVFDSEFIGQPDVDAVRELRQRAMDHLTGKTLVEVVQRCDTFIAQYGHRTETRAR